METHGDGVVPSDGRDEQEVRGRQAGVFMESGCGEEAKFPVVKESQLDNAGSVAAVVEAGHRRMFRKRGPEQGR
jgi:hypothetical protein